jgi:hypothetical protein
LLEGEVFWWFGNSYSGEMPNELYVCDPIRMRHESDRPEERWGKGGGGFASRTTD